MSHEREPIKQTCPEIDKYIRSIKRETVSSSSIKNMELNDLVDLAENMNNELDNCIGYFEEIRKSNETLRQWGCEEAEEVDNLKNYID